MTILQADSSRRPTNEGFPAPLPFIPPFLFILPEHSSAFAVANVAFRHRSTLTYLSMVEDLFRDQMSHLNHYISLDEPTASCFALAVSAIFFFFFYKALCFKSRHIS